MKKPPSKTDLRERLQRQTAAFLSSGGKVKEFQAGESAYDRSETPPPAPLFETRRVERTPLTDVIAALDSRRAAKRARTKVVRPQVERREPCPELSLPLVRLRRGLDHGQNGPNERLRLGHALALCGIHSCAALGRDERHFSPQLVIPA